MPERDKWLRVGDIAQKLGISQWKARLLIDNGELPGRKLAGGGHRQALESAVEQYRLALEDPATWSKKGNS